MIRPAIMYKEQLIRKFGETFYDTKYMYYYDTTPGIPDIEDKPDNHYQFVSVDKNDEVVGFFSYWVYEPARRAMNFGLIAFQKEGKNNIIFMRDAEQMFKDMFEKYGLYSAEWRCYTDNTNGIKLYDHVIKKYGGIRACVLRNNGVPQNRKLSDTVLYEVLKSDLCFKCGKIIPKNGN